MATNTQPPRRQTPSPEGNATYIDFTKLNEGRFLLARINRANSHWSGRGEVREVRKHGLGRDN